MLERKLCNLDAADNARKLIFALFHIEPFYLCERPAALHLFLNEEVRAGKRRNLRLVRYTDDLPAA